MRDRIALRWIDENRGLLEDMSDRIWDFAEIGLKEEQSAGLLMDTLENEGFKIEQGLGGMPTAFKAVWGEGKPVIGLLGEYDALKSSSQQRGKAEHSPIIEGGPGHACGHNLLGVAMMASAIAVKRELCERGLGGSVVFYGCPAEEFLLGKIYMAKDGAFRDLDVALTWHPDTTNYPDESIFQAMYNVKFNFYGTPAHASESPEQGRSALDAVELMNVGVNYLREHMVSNARIHYVISNGGGVPNTVPEYAQVWYFIRGPENITAKSLFERVKKIAEGAAMMTETRMDMKFITACYENLPNDVLLETLHQAINETEPQHWKEEDFALAAKLIETYDKRAYQRSVERLSAATGTMDDQSKLLFNRSMPLNHSHPYLPLGSSDFGDVTWIAPSAMAYIACCPVNTPYHSWQWAVAVGSGIGKEGMLFAAKVFAIAALDLIEHPEKVAAAQEEFAKRTEGNPYHCMIAADAKVPFEEF